MNKRAIAVLLLVAALAATVGALLPTDTAQALPCKESSTDFYSDGTYTTIVGGREVTCWGVFTWGQVTIYRITYPGDYCFGCGPGW